ncbi:EpsG family protein [Empedobacter sp. ULE_I140]
MNDKLIFDSLYNILYFSFALSVLLFSFQIDFKGYTKITHKIGKCLTLFFLVAYILLIGTRAYDVGTDTVNYYKFNWQMDTKSDGGEFLLVWIVQFVKIIGGSFTWFLLLISFIFFYLNYKTYYQIGKIFNTNVIFILFSLISLFFTKSLSINIIRQGLALAILTYAYSKWFNQNKITIELILLLLVSMISHTTSIVPIFIFTFLQWKTKKISINFFLFIYITGIVLSVINIGLLNIAPFLNNIITDRRSIYIAKDSDLEYSVGFKPNFILFNTIFLLIFYYRLKKIREVSQYEKYENLLKYFIVTSFLFFMTFQIPYSDRWGLFSWIAIPILATPIFSYRNYKKFYIFPWVIFFILVFSFFIFYG